MARHFGEKASLSLMPTYVHRNYVAADDVNDLFALGGAFRVKLTSRFAIVGEYYQTFANKDFRQKWYKNSHCSFLKLHVGRSILSISDSSSTGDANKECAVNAPSNINAARLIEAHNAIRIP